MTTKILGIALATLVLLGSAYADAVFAFGNHPQPNEENIFFSTDVTGSTIVALTNKSYSMVQYSSTTDTLVGHGGQ